MLAPKSLAFVDVETTGLSPATHRIAEIGVVTVDGASVDRWTTFVDVARHRERASTDLSSTSSEMREGAPGFSRIARDLFERLSGRLLIAHNARFDHAFLRAEFDRVGIAFAPQVLCSVMLSRKLYPHLPHHDLDSLIECHGLHVEVRHRALPDAEVLWQWWQVVGREHHPHAIGEATAALLAGPVLPQQLDPALIDRLPGSPGAYVFRDERGNPLFVGAAANLKQHVVNYFRLDRATGKALEYAHRIADISWRATRGMVGAQLHAASLDRAPAPAGKRNGDASVFTWQFSPDCVPCVTVAPLSHRDAKATAESFGIFESERKAWNALVRLATRERLCHCLLGLARFAKSACLGCPCDQPRVACVTRVGRQRQLIRVYAALKPERVADWPYRGPIGIRERSDVHVADGWQFLGTAQSQDDLFGLLESRPQGFDRRLYRLLKRTLARVPPGRIVDLSRYESPARCSA